MGSFPILRSLALDSMFEGLPVLLVSKLDELSSEILERIFKGFKSKNYTISKLYLLFWLDKIKEHGKMLENDVLNKVRVP